ncbi:septum formation family protein [Actinomyces sp. zg296]|uniref:septum formation family protein n=1 Tax=Actinomyces sp. zg296 TaxID=2609289 RepID=UPI00135B60C3|nr:septum formation family protein [Actinomyces sp. zg296]
MKKTTHALIIPAAFLLTAGLAACGDAPATTIGTPPPTTQEAPTTQAPPPAQATPNAQESPRLGIPAVRATKKAGGGSTSKPGSGSGRLGVVNHTKLRVGDCFNDLGNNPNEVEDIELVSCDSPHMNEAYHTVVLKDATYPSYPTTSEWPEVLRSSCNSAFKSYVGIDRDSSTTYRPHAFYPSAQNWAQGDRTISCLITSKDGNPLTGSAAATMK